MHKRDGFEAINALVPFPKGRGLIFIDPSYEVKEEYKIISSTIQKVYVKFSQGIYLVWYPLLPEARHKELTWELNNYFVNNTWQHEWQFSLNNSKGLCGSGIIIINPPWKFESIIQESLQFLLNHLSQDNLNFY